MWFSALLTFTIFAEDTGSSRTAKSLILFTSADFENAKKKALRLGRNKETSYTNGEGKLIEWRLSALETLDALGKTIEDDKEVYSEFNEIPQNDKLPFDAVLRPELSKPTQTGV